ncbi:molecular chaperone [Albidovulum sediminicola]|uniref:Molecular chaperone TorD family protein n=1 Tax=Albidovulum sediminicola TaxID=2984331 RepID=A0ABT2Z074_9RHOB|nr:molecular chaperone TorD family protein [Defluviimonas sp. WL0075]MCV2864524.1 molecular chaperone TorD family protein [Defluviimonas sp. WL0075]
MTEAAETIRIAEEDQMRADLYSFLSALLAAPPDRELLAKCVRLKGDETPMGNAIGALNKLAQAATPGGVEREFNDLFIGLGRGELVPYASFYLTGFLNEKPLAVLRGDMARHGIARSKGVFEPEDGIASLMEMMAALIEGRFGPPASVEEQREFFNRNVGSWAGHFFADLEGAKTSVFYAPVGTVGRLFMQIEKEAFRLSGA